MNIGFLPWICVALFFWVPHLGLDYVFHINDGTGLQLKNGQYYFFGATIISGYAFLIHASSWKDIYALKNNYLIICGLLGLLGVAFSSSDLGDWRTLLIILAISGAALCIASWAVKLDEKNAKKLIFILLLAFSVPVLGAVILHFFGPLNILFGLKNMMHEEYYPPRWYFMNSFANGFGFDAALLSFGSYFFIREEQSLLKRLVASLILLIACYGLFNSGTRAAVLLLIVAVVMYEFIYSNYKAVAVKLLLSGLALATLFTLLGWNNVINYLRLNGSLDEISSLRLGGISGLWSIFLNSPVIGIGFGNIDDIHSMEVKNILYLGLLVEIGVFGALGVFGILAYPFIKTSWSQVFTNQKNLDRETALIYRFSMPLSIAFLVYNLFEFSIIRVSLNNQIFMFCWASLLFYNNTNIKYRKH